MKNLLVAQSGGPTAAINATLAGVIQGGLEAPGIDKIYGAVHGIEGVFRDRVIELNDIDLEILKQTPSAYLGSCRNKLPEIDSNPAVFREIFSWFEKMNIGYFLYIGGNDSMDTVCKLSDYAKLYGQDVKVIGVPKTIDNDLDHTDHTPGFGSAAKYIATSIAEITKDSQVYFLKSVTIIEIMGRHAGWLTAASALARNEHRKAPHLVYLPEVSFSEEQFLSDIRQQFENGVTNVIVAVSEGIRDKNGKFICEDEKNVTLDAFGHKNLSGVGKILENLVKSEIGCKVRSIELNVCQRCAGHLLSKTDIEESFAIGKEGVVTAVKGVTGEMMVFKRLSTKPYKIAIESVDIHKSANVEKIVPQKYIVNGNDVTSELIDELRPLILGEVPVSYREDGLPVYLHR